MLFALCGRAPVARAQPVSGGGPPEAARVYDYCRARADAAFQHERQIDQDILATRGIDWQRAGTLRRQRSEMFAEAAGRADAVFALCLRARAG